MTFVISSNEKVFVIYNVAVRTASVFNFIINSLNNYFMIKSTGLNRKEQFEFGIKNITRQKKNTTTHSIPNGCFNNCLVFLQGYF